MRRPAALARLSLLAALLGPTPARAQAPAHRFVKAPYLQALTGKSVSIRWEGSDASPAAVELTGPDGHARSVAARESTPYHAVDIEGLSPATAYAYRVKVGDAQSPDGHFTTAPPDDARRYSFLVYGDNRSDQRAHSAVIKAMGGAPGDFLVHTGDMVENGDDPGMWNAFFETESPLLRDRCVFACIGNHELSGGNARNYLRYFQSGHDEKGERSLFYSVRWGTARFFVLNAFATWASGADRGWLEQALTRAVDEPGLLHRFVIMHQGPGSSGPHGPNSDFLAAGFGDQLRQLKVTMVLAGHDHLYERGERGGVKYLLSGGGGAPLYRPRRSLDSSTQALEVVHHFVEVQVDGDDVTTVARRVDGTIMETCHARPEAWDCHGMRNAHEPGAIPSRWPAPFDRCDCAQVGAPAPSSPLPLALATLVASGGRLRRSPRRR